MAQSEGSGLDMVTPDMIIARQRLQELRQEADEYRRTGRPATGRITKRILTALGMVG